MHMFCKLVPGSRLTGDDLTYVLMPDELIGQFSCAPNQGELRSQLPAALRDSLSHLSGHQGMLDALRRELQSGNWFALSSFPRKQPFSEAQLSRYPALKQRIARLTGQSQYVKANFNAVTDDVLLPKQMAYTPVEPSPDHKIVVEFAGQWPNNAACLMLGKTEAQKEKVTAANADMDNKHRSLATFKDLEAENKTLYIKIPCTDQPTPILLKLAENLQPVEKETRMEEWETVLIPVLPVIPAGEAYELHKSGYFYIVWKNKVWRELEVTSGCYFADVDVDYYRNRDPAAGMKMRHIDIDGALIDSGGYLGDEPFEVYQKGTKVFSGKLGQDQTGRVFGLTEEEVEVKFTSLDMDAIPFTTRLSPFKAGENISRVARGMPLPHIWVPYKITGEVQECYLHYSREQLTLAQLSELEADPASVSIPLSALSVYSDSQSFAGAGERIIASSQAQQNASGAALLNSQTESNIAAVKLPPVGARPAIRYKYEPGVDQDDDFFAIRNTEQDWMHKSYIRSATKDNDGYLILYFASPPREVETVDLVRGAHSNPGNGIQHFIVIEEDIPVSELLG